jgi:phage shock protein C
MYGLAEYFNQDPVLFRIVAIAFLIITGIFPGILLYLAAWIVVPKKDSSDVEYTIVE